MATADEDLRIFLNKPVNVITCDGRVIVGVLKTFDQVMNLVLSHTHERYFSLDKPVSVVQLGAYLIRGDNVAIVGEIDEKIEATIDYANLKASPLHSFVL